jgi:hypothetical protein
MLCPDKLVCEEDVQTVKVMGGNAMVAVVPGTYWGFVWHGGAYIDVIRQSSMGTFELNGIAYFYGEQNINVWDYDTGMPMIPWQDKEQFVNTINEWVEGMNG